MRTLLMFLWLAVPIGAWAAYASWGLPHVIWTYSFYSDDPFDPLAPRDYYECTYIGWYGEFTVPDQGGRCPFLRAFQRRANQ